MKTAYPVYIVKNADAYLVYVPDMDLFTEGTSPADAIAMARDAISNMGITLQNDNHPLPAASTYGEAKEKTIQQADDIDFQYSKGICTLVDVDLDEYRRKLENRAVKKNCTIPYQLSVLADQAGVNYSRVLQDALKEKLNMA